MRNEKNSVKSQEDIRESINITTRKGGGSHDDYKRCARSAFAANIRTTTKRIEHSRFSPQGTPTSYKVIYETHPRLQILLNVQHVSDIPDTLHPAIIYEDSSWPTRRVVDEPVTRGEMTPGLPWPDECFHYPLLVTYVGRHYGSVWRRHGSHGLLLTTTGIRTPAMQRRQSKHIWKGRNMNRRINTT